MKVGALVHMYPPLHNAGAEHMLHSIFVGLMGRGIECSVAIEPYGGAGYELEGVRVGGREVLVGCDILLTHLDRTPEAEAYSLEHRVPLAQIMHNHQRPHMARVCHLAIYNSNWIADQRATVTFPQSIVVHPPVWPQRYRVAPGQKVTLVNLQKAKGVGLFYQLAAAMPDVQFLGVRGAYGAQEAPPALGNLAIMPQQDDVRRVYEQTRVLLMPSEYESYGRCAVEAAVSGIPTIANPTPGLREALGPQGTFPRKLDGATWETALRGVLGRWEEHSQQALCLANTLDPAADIDRLSIALESTIKRGPVPARVGRVVVLRHQGLRYPVRLAKDCSLEGVRYPRGTCIDHKTALALKAAGQLKDERIV